METIKMLPYKTRLYKKEAKNYEKIKRPLEKNYYLFTHLQFCFDLISFNGICFQFFRCPKRLLGKGIY